MANVVSLRYSKDGGRNWSAWKLRDLGETGQFMKRVKFLQLGQGLQWVFQFKVTSAVRAPLVAASIKFEGDDS